MDRWTKERHDKLIFQLDNDAKHPIPAEIRAEILRALTEVVRMRDTLVRIKRRFKTYLQDMSQGEELVNNALDGGTLPTEFFDILWGDGR